MEFLYLCINKHKIHENYKNINLQKRISIVFIKSITFVKNKSK
jgi:hypothetical protein